MNVVSALKNIQNFMFWVIFHKRKWTDKIYARHAVHTLAIQKLLRKKIDECNLSIPLEILYKEKQNTF